MKLLKTFNPRAARLALASLSVGLAGFLLCAMPARAQSYGTNPQVLALGAGAFHATYSGTNYAYTAADYLSTPGGVFYAHLDLPEGAVVTGLCVYGKIDVEGAFVYAEIRGAKQAPGGTNGGVHAFSESHVVDSAAIGYGVVCSTPFELPLRQVTDLDGDGDNDNVAYYLAAGIQDAGFGGVRVFWHRQVSPPAGPATFNDVPVTDPFFPFVEALVASGITAGCGGNNFCPDAPLTRRQMAAFLAKALGLHWQTF